ncbi:MAG TPA: hypothetical protein VGG61_01095, partial [Gemmataceae bacterium]
MPNGYRDHLGCPDPTELAGFAAGNLSGKVFARIAGHIERCSACETALGALEDPTDPFLARLRMAAVDNPSPAPLVPAELLAAAQSCRQETERVSAWSTEHPRRLGKFELLEELGYGSFGQVFRARDTELGRTVAIKVLRAGRLA